MDIPTSGFNFTSSKLPLCRGKRCRLNVVLLLAKWSMPMSIPFLCQWPWVIFPDLRFANCRKVWVYIYAKPAAAGGGGAESCLLSIHFGWDSENCSICSVADTAPSPATTATLHNNQLLYSLYICKKCVFSFYAQHSLEDSLDAVYHMLAHFPIFKTDATRVGNEPSRSLKLYNHGEGQKCWSAGSFDQD